MLAGAFTSCSSDYLDLAPEISIPNDEVATTPEGMRSATYGVFGNMYRQYSSLYDYLWFNGEPYLSMVYGEAVGQDYISYFWTYVLKQVPNWEVMTMTNSWPAFIPWTYCYGIIGAANNLIVATDNEESQEDEEIRFRRAQCLTMRAHAYTRLLQLYAPRWTDSRNGEMVAVPLRLTPVDPDNPACPLSTMGQVLDQIYKDLDEALELFASTKINRSYYWETDADIARGLYARAAMLKNDYKTAQQMAHDARQDYPIMSSDEWLSGFAEPNAEWMWCNQEGYSNVYYASFGASYACNGAYPTLWGNIGAGAMSVDLFNQFQTRDNRKSVFFMPATAGVFAGKADFYSSKNVVAASMNVNRGTLAKAVGEFIQKMYAKTGADKGWFPPYTNPTTGDYSSTMVQFGAQFKFWGTDVYASSQFPYMRGAEMLFIEAEAAYLQGDEDTARKLINEINALRIDKYKDITDSGEALYDQIKLAKRLEMWGEGYNWFDMKRRGDTMERRAWVEGDTDSGNWPSSLTLSGFDYTPAAHNGWRWAIPDSELQYNTAINYTDLEYTE